MIKKITLLLLFVFCLSMVTEAQRSRRWKRYRYEVVGGIGVSNFLGDLGGANGDGGAFVKDMDLAATRPALSIGMRYRMTERWSTKVSLSYAVLSGDDEDTDWSSRNGRNLDFKTNLIEFGGQLEFSIIKERSSARYRVRRGRGLGNLKINTYLFAGLAGFWFNPYGQHPTSNKWVELQPLGTEGQGKVAGKEKYSLLQVAIPYGIGFKYNIDRLWAIGLEIGARHTFTDYIDDVSTDYVSKDILDNSLAETMSDKRETPVYKGTRGNPDSNDSYVFFMLTVSYKLKATRNGWPKFGKKRSRPKFSMRR